MDGTESTMDRLPVLKIVDSSLRISVVPLAVASIWITMTNQEENSSYGLLKYNSISGLKYMVWISAICAAYAVVAAVASWIRCFVSKAWIFFISDQIMAYMMVTSGAAVLEISYLTYKGDIEVSWSEACSSYGRFCSKMKVAWFLHVLALCCYFVLAVISAYRTFSTFEPPIYPKEVEENRT